MRGRQKRKKENDKGMRGTLKRKREKDRKMRGSEIYFREIEGEKWEREEVMGMKLAF